MGKDQFQSAASGNATLQGEMKDLTDSMSDLATGLNEECDASLDAIDSVSPLVKEYFSAQRTMEEAFTQLKEEFGPSIYDSVDPLDENPEFTAEQLEYEEAREARFNELLEENPDIKAAADTLTDPDVFKAVKLYESERMMTKVVCPADRIPDLSKP